MDTSTIIISSNVPNYQSFFESHFLDYLKKTGASGKTRNNYRTDLRNFLQWISTTIQIPTANSQNTYVNLLRSLSPGILKQYTAFLLENKTPITTVNRRLSAMRSFFRFCILQGWLDRNPADAVRNITKTENRKQNPDHEKALLVHFTEYLVREGSSDKTQNNYRTDLRHFIQWASLTITKSNASVPSNHVDLVRSMSPQLLDEYVSVLLENKTPITTVNRRLSAIRSFFRFCIVSGWLHRNPADAIRNVTKTDRPDETIQRMLTSFKSKLKEEGLSDDAAGNELTEIAQFLLWVKSRTERA